MAIQYKSYFDRHEIEELSPMAEQVYISLFREESASYIEEALKITKAEDGFAWSDLEEFVVDIAATLKERRGKIITEAKHVLSPLNKPVPTHVPLTDELTEERKQAMLEAASIIRGHLDYLSGGVRDVYTEIANNLEQRANALETHTGDFNPQRYNHVRIYPAINPVCEGAWTGRC